MTKAPCPDLADLLPQWQDSLLAQRGLSPNTAEAYRQDLESYFLFRAELQAEPGILSEQDIFFYLAWLRARQNTGRTLARRLSALRTFFCLCCG